VEEIYNLEDALVVAGFLHSFVRHADVLKIANLAQIVNVIAPLITRGSDLLVQSTFYPLAMFAERRNGVALRAAVDGPVYEGAANGRVHTIDSSAILDGSRLHVFLTNRSLDETAEVAIQLGGQTVTACESAELLTGPGAKAANTFEDGTDVVKAQPFKEIRVVDGQAVCQLPPLSFAAITLKLA
jgi:alpha-L-arabinofuranosidase